MIYDSLSSASLCFHGAHHRLQRPSIDFLSSSQFSNLSSTASAPPPVGFQQTTSLISKSGSLWWNEIIIIVAAGDHRKIDHERACRSAGDLGGTKKQGVVAAPDICLENCGTESEMTAADLPALEWRLDPPCQQTERSWARCPLKPARCSPVGRRANQQVLYCPVVTYKAHFLLGNCVWGENGKINVVGLNFRVTFRTRWLTWLEQPRCLRLFPLFFWKKRECHYRSKAKKGNVRSLSGFSKGLKAIKTKTTCDAPGIGSSSICNY